MTGRGQISYVQCHTMAVVELLRAVRDELVRTDGHIAAARLSAAHLRTFSNPVTSQYTSTSVTRLAADSQPQGFGDLLTDRLYLFASEKHTIWHECSKITEAGCQRGTNTYRVLPQWPDSVIRPHRSHHSIFSSHTQCTFTHGYTWTHAFTRGHG